jgi:ribosomal protein S18 acetylase RimI-like enzyme
VCHGAALWLPPGVHPDEAALAALFQNTVDETKRPDLFGACEQMGTFHPEEPHWYLPLIGIDPPQRGKGLGAALMRHALAECDRSRTLAYLESSDPRNIGFYQRHGYELLGTIESGARSPIFPMLRKPQ